MAERTVSGLIVERLSTWERALLATYTGQEKRA